MVTTNSRLARRPAGHPGSCLREKSPPSCSPTVGNAGGAGPVGFPTPPAASTGVSVGPACSGRDPRCTCWWRPAAPSASPAQEFGKRTGGSCSLSWPAGRRTSEAAMPPFHSFNTFTQGLLCAPHWGAGQKNGTRPLPRGLPFTKMAEMREPSDS